MTILSEALRYLESGRSIIPVSPRDKRPLLAWEEYQRRRPERDEVLAWWRKYPDAMVGIVTGAISDLFVLDLDVGHSGDIHEKVADNVLFPIATTPRGGQHWYFAEPKEKKLTIGAGILPHVDFRCNGGFIIAPPSCNASGGRYQWRNGLDLFTQPPGRIPAQLWHHISKHLNGNSSGRNGVPDGEGGFFEQGKRDHSLFHIAHCLIRGKADEKVMQEAMSILGKHCDPPFPDAEIEEKINSARKRAKGKERNITEDVRHWIQSQTGDITITACYQDLKLVTSPDKRTCKQVFSVLHKEGVIKRDERRLGVYHIPEAEADEIDFMNVEERVINLDWPFNLQSWVKILPRNIIVLAGESNSGKTAFLLNFCARNLGKMPINYFSSEMGALELRDRLKKFNLKLSTWKEHVNFRDRSSGFGDVIKPDEVNVIDFLEMSDEFYKIGGAIKEIFDRLRDGIAVIAIQKPRGRDLGIGGERSIEKARLYLAMEPGRIKIVKGKNWAHSERNPNGAQWGFKLVQGSVFMLTEEPKSQFG